MFLRKTESLNFNGTLGILIAYIIHWSTNFWQKMKNTFKALFTTSISEKRTSIIHYISCNLINTIKGFPNICNSEESINFDIYLAI